MMYFYQLVVSAVFGLTSWRYPSNSSPVDIPATITLGHFPPMEEFHCRNKPSKSIQKITMTTHQMLKNLTMIPPEDVFLPVNYLNQSWPHSTLKEVPLQRSTSYIFGTTTLNHLRQQESHPTDLWIIRVTLVGRTRLATWTTCHQNDIGSSTRPGLTTTYITHTTPFRYTQNTQFQYFLIRTQKRVNQ